MSRRRSGYREAWATLVEIFGPNCVYCHRNSATQIDHVIPYSYIECNRIENLRPACQWCNLMASDKVFEDFDAKYEWLREERSRGKWKKKYRMHTCSECLLPFYTMLHANEFLCPRCYAIEYQKPESQKSSWKEWKKTLVSAGFSPQAHYAMADRLHGTWGILYKDRIEILVDEYANVFDFHVDIDTVMAFSGFG